MTFDTRPKILSLDQAQAVAAELHRDRTSVTAFVSHLEVLRAAQSQALQDAWSAESRLFVILTEPESPLVSLEARAEVAAGLRVVDYVVPSPEGAVTALAALQPDRIIHDEEADRGRTRDLIAHVRSRARS